MTDQIINAAPMVIERGTQDLSTRTLPRVPESIPQHLAKFFIFARKGDGKPQLVSGVERDNVFGTESFNLRGKYANHSTVFSNLVNAEGNAQILQRLIPHDAGPEANLIAWLDVLPTVVDLYERNSDGSIKLDLAGTPIITGTTNGYKVKWVITHRSSVSSMADFGTATVMPGDQVDQLTSTQSERYPIFELKASSVGEYGNLSGIRLWAPTVGPAQALPTKMMAEEMAYPYFISVIRKATATSTPALVETIFGERRVLVTFKPDVIDPLTDKELYIGDTFINSYQNVTDDRYPKLHGDFGTLHVYNSNIETLTGLFHAAEAPYIDQFSDIKTDAVTKHLFNFVSGVSSFNVPYHSFVFVDNNNSTRFSELTNIYAAGSSDGTMNDTVHAQLVEEAMAAYLDPNNEVQDLAYNVESIIYDTGFPLSTKYSLCNFIAQRKDTFTALGTHTVGDRILDASEEHSIAIALRTRLQMYPESDFFGTPVMRGMIIGRSGKLRNSQYTKHLPLTAEIAIKSARFMGAGNGRWKDGQHFDGAPGSIVENMYDININWVSASVRNRNWDVGLNFVLRYDRSSYFFPALKTVYENNTSVLNSYFTAMAICQLNKISHAAWREFTGTSGLTNAQLIERVNEFVNKRTQNRFADRFVIVPDAQITDADLVRGFSWTLPIKIYANNLMSLMITHVQAYRMEDLQQ